MYFTWLLILAQGPVVVNCNFVELLEHLFHFVANVRWTRLSLTVKYSERTNRCKVLNDDYNNKEYTH